MDDQAALFEQSDGPRSALTGKQLPAYPLYDGTPPHQRAATSHAAAEQIRRDVNRLQARVLQLIREAPDGLTDEQGIEASGMPSSTWRPRRRELELLELIEYRGERLTRSRRRAKVWRPKEER